MKRKWCILIAMLSLFGCTNPYEYPVSRAEKVLGKPVSQWTQRERQAYLICRYEYARSMRDYDTSHPIPQPGPIIPYTEVSYPQQAPARAGTTTVIPNNRYNPSAGATVWGDHHGQIIYDADGGYTYWGD